MYNRIVGERGRWVIQKVLCRALCHDGELHRTVVNVKDTLERLRNTHLIIRYVGNRNW